MSSKVSGKSTWGSPKIQDLHVCEEARGAMIEIYDLEAKSN